MIRYPFEGDKHYGTIIMIPYRDDIWLNGGKDAIDTIYQMVSILVKYEKVFLICHPTKIDYIKDKFKFDNLHIIEALYNDAWARDICPLFGIENNKLKAICFDFNAWGGDYDGLYNDYSDDIKIKDIVVNYFNITSNKVKFVLEGGSINTNGNKLLTTRACLLSLGRNPKYSEEDITNILKKELNQNEIIWLDNGIDEDETNEHVDNMACFLDENTIALAYGLEEKQKENSLSAYNKLISLDYKVVKLPVPSLYLTSEEEQQIKLDDSAKNRLANTKLAASYVNFYQSDKYILLPQFGVKEDEIAYDILNNFYQGKKEIYKISSRSILVSGGNIHCITMQIPEVSYES